MFHWTLLSELIGASLILTSVVASAAPQDGGPAKKPDASAPVAKADPPRSQAPARPPGSRTLLPRAFDEAFRVARAMRDPVDRAAALETLGQAQNRLVSPLAARKTLLEARAAAEAIPPDADLVIHPIIGIAEAQVAAGDREAARQTFKVAVRMIAAEPEDHQVKQWGHMIWRQLTVESRPAMADTFRAFRRAGENSKFGGRDSVIFLDAAINGNVEKTVGEITSRKTIDVRLSKRIPLDLESWRCGQLLSVMKCFGHDERAKLKPVRDEIRKIVGTRLDPFFRPHILQELADQEARLGFYNEAVTAAEAIDPKDADRPDDPVFGDMGTSSKVNAFTGIASRRLEAGDLEGARRTARQAVEAAGAMKGQSDTKLPLNRAVEVLIRAGDFEEARRAIDSIWPPSAVDLLRTLANAEARHGNMEQARDTRTKALKLARDNHLSTETVAEVQAEMGDVAAAIEAVNTLEQERKQEALAQVALGLAHAGRLDDAVSVVEKISDPAIRDQTWIEIVAWCPAP